MIYFTSDTHFGHANVAGPNSKWKNGFRTFNSAKEMDEELLYQLNKIGINDTIYHLGDFSFNRNPKKYFDQINCKNIHLILGNHDKIRNLKNIDFLSISSAKEIYVEKQKICMSHYAHRVWNKSHHGSYHLFGHSHNSLTKEWGRSLDVGVDSAYAILGEYRPFSFDEIDNILSKRDNKVSDHHI